MLSDGLPPPPSPAPRCMQVVRERALDGTATGLFFFAVPATLLLEPQAAPPSHLGYGEGLGFRVWGFTVSSLAGIWAAGFFELKLHRHQQCNLNLGLGWFRAF